MRSYLLVMLYRHDYSFALDVNSHPISIKDATKGNGNRYYCLCCGDEMIAKQGKIRKWHFTHKTKTANCSYETYLHKLAKLRIKEFFLTSKEFNISIESNSFCRKECLFNKGNCLWQAPKFINLKDFYNQCREEQHIGPYVADLVLSNSENHNINPILIEVYKTHTCSVDKINSGHLIIEFLIESEDDINAITSKSPIHIYSSMLNDCRPNHSIKAIFYNFKIKDSILLHREFEIYRKAKQQLREYFITSEEINISFKRSAECNIDKCFFPFKRKNKCCWATFEPINLKEFYNNCSEIANFDNLIVLENINKPQRPKLIIEICTPINDTKKIIKKNRAITLCINSEKDIDNITSSQIIYDSKLSSNSSANVRFQNFKNKTISRKPNIENQQRFFVFWIDKKNYLHKEQMTCLESFNRFKQKFCFISKTDPKTFLFKKLSESNLDIKYCPMCEYYVNNYSHISCRKYISKQREAFPMPPTAMNCLHFKQTSYYADTEKMAIYRRDLLDMNEYIEYQIFIPPKENNLFSF